MHSAAEIQAQLHRLCTKIAEPARRGRRQVECHDIAIAEGAGDRGLRHQLLLHIGQAQQGIAAIGVDGFTKVFDTGLVQGGQCPLLRILSSIMLGAALPGNLQGRIRA